MRTLPVTRSGNRSRRLTVSFIALLALLATIPIVALWRAFAPRELPAPDFTLTDQNDRPFTLSAWRGHPVVLFFGYTHCPDACPTTLAHLARAVHAVDAPSDVRVAFITVDPYRDSPAVLKRYVSLFDRRFTGLTGDLKTLDPVYSAYHTWRQAVPVRHTASNYSMAHGTSLYYIGRNGTIKGFGNWDEDTTAIIHDLKVNQ